MGKPKIRFEGYSEDWEQRKLSEIAIEKLSNGIMNNQANDETGLRHINVINMYDPDKIHPEKLTFSNYDEDAVKKCNVEWGDIFLTRSSLKPEGIAESNVLLDSGRFVYDDHLIRLKLDKEKYDPFFVKLNLSGSIFKRQFIVRAKTTAFTTIGQEDIAECFGLFPEKEEQEKIGTYFSNLDHLITLHQRKYDETKTLKKYMLQKMFPQNGEKVPEIRFDGFTEDWEQRKLDDVVEFLDTMRKPLEGAKRIPGLYPYYGASGIVDYVDGYLFDEELILLSEDGANITDRNYPVCFLASGKYWVNNHAHVLRTKQENENNFICNSLERKDYTQYNTGMAMPKLNKETCKKIPISCPGFEEQKKIGDYFRSLDHLITLYQRKCNELKEIKKYMLQNMFV